MEAGSAFRPACPEHRKLIVLEQAARQLWSHMFGRGHGKMDDSTPRIRVPRVRLNSRRRLDGFCAHGYLSIDTMRRVRVNKAAQCG